MGGGFYSNQYWNLVAGDILGSNTVLSGSLSYPGITTSGNSLQLTGTGSGSGAGVAYSTALAPATVSNLPSDTNHGKLFISALVQLNNVSGAVVFYPLNGTTTNGFFGMNSNAGNTDWFLHSSNGSNSFATAASTSTTLLVEERDYNGAASDTVELYIDPDLSNPVPSISLTGQTLTQVNGLELYTGNTTTQTGIFDEFNIGNTFADVVGTPEPASLGLFALGGIAVLGRRSRRRESPRR